MHIQLLLTSKYLWRAGWKRQAESWQSDFNMQSSSVLPLWQSSTLELPLLAQVPSPTNSGMVTIFMVFLLLLFIWKAEKETQIFNLLVYSPNDLKSQVEAKEPRILFKLPKTGGKGPNIGHNNDCLPRYISRKLNSWCSNGYCCIGYWHSRWQVLHCTTTPTSCLCILK